MFTVQACQQFTAPKEIKDIVESSDNQIELNKVIAHYSEEPSDSLKLKATYFLLKNMEGWYYYEGSQLDHYQEYFKLIRRDEQHGAYFMYAFNNLYAPFSVKNLKKCNDIETVRANDMINNIDLAFKVWQEQPWGKHLKFNDFCEYVLPFRIKDEVPADNRKDLYERFNHLLDSLRRINGDAVAAGRVINDELGQPKWLFTDRTSFLPHFKASQITKYRAGSCREMTDLALYVMRSVGIPVAIDFVQQWPYRSSGHEFNVLLDSHGKMVSFLGAEDSPGTPHKPLTKKGKVYRHIFENNPLSLANFIKPGEEVPVFLKDKKIKDVTDEYAVVHPVTILLGTNGYAKSANARLVYLTVFDNKKWVPIDGAVISNNQASFKKLEGNIVYMPGYYRNREILPAGSPFILDEHGQMHMLIASHKLKHQRMNVSRLFPITADNYDPWNIRNCRFQGSNKPDFSNAVDLYRIDNKPNPFWNAIQIKQTPAFRYLRFWSGSSTYIGEIEFYAKGKKLNGTPIGTTTGWFSEKTFKRAFDGDIFTDFDSNGSSSPTWAGLDLGSSHHVDSIRYSAPIREDTTTRVLPHHQYELFYWDKDIWVSAGNQTSTGTHLTFHLIPQNTLYLLKDRTESVEERIFTYVKGKQVWW